MQGIDYKSFLLRLGAEGIYSNISSIILSGNNFTDHDMKSIIPAFKELNGAFPYSIDLSSKEEFNLKETLYLINLSTCFQKS